jgi:hypothetical protein
MQQSSFKVEVALEDASTATAYTKSLYASLNTNDSNFPDQLAGVEQRIVRPSVVHCG